MRTLFALLLLFAVNVFGRSEPIIETPLGKIKGNPLIVSNEFLGIRFGTPPVGNLRFRPSTIYNQSWKPETYDATAWGPACMQTAPYGIKYPSGTSEDCLYLNIWQPTDATATNTKPVLLFIHGGFGTWGSPSEQTWDGKSQYNGTVLASFDIVVVTIQYRLNVFGAFTNAELKNENTNWPAYGGMNYLWDQINAIKWTRQNIKQFGGNPNDITIFGESFGANSVCNLIVAPFAGGLFKNVLQESGACNGGWGPLPLDLGLNASNVLMTYTGTKNLEQVRALSAKDLEHASNVTGYGGSYIDDYLMPVPPYVYFENATYDVNPTGFIIFGSDEMDGVTGPPFYTGAQPQNKAQYEALLNVYLTPPETSLVLKQYPYNDTISPSWAWWEIGSDLCVRCQTLYAADGVYAKQKYNKNNPNVYVYQFDGPDRSSQPPSPHGGELCFLFNAVQTNGLHNSCQSFFVVAFNETYAQWMQQSVVSAIKNPNNAVLSTYKNVTWPIYGINGHDAAVIWDDDPHVVLSQPDRDNCQFWLDSGINRTAQTYMCWNFEPIPN